jgi:hypothetical protein
MPPRPRACAPGTPETPPAQAANAGSLAQRDEKHNRVFRGKPPLIEAILFLLGESNAQCRRNPPPIRATFAQLRGYFALFGGTFPLIRAFFALFGEAYAINRGVFPLIRATFAQLWEGFALFRGTFPLNIASISLFGEAYAQLWEGFALFGGTSPRNWGRLARCWAPRSTISESSEITVMIKSDRVRPESPVPRP